MSKTSIVSLVLWLVLPFISNFTFNEKKVGLPVKVIVGLLAYPLFGIIFSILGGIGLFMLYPLITYFKINWFLTFSYLSINYDLIILAIDAILILAITGYALKKETISIGSTKVHNHFAKVLISVCVMYPVTALVFNLFGIIGLFMIAPLKDLFSMNWFIGF